MTTEKMKELLSSKDEKIRVIKLLDGLPKFLMVWFDGLVDFYHELLMVWFDGQI